MKNLIIIILILILMIQAYGQQPYDLPGWPVLVDSAICTSPAIIDINGDGENEIIFPTYLINLHVFNYFGQYLAGWPQPYGRAKSAAVADVDNDGTKEIFAGKKGGVYAVRYDGSLVEGWPNLSPEDTVIGVSIGDLNHDGILEIAAGLFSTSKDNYGNHYLWEPTGEVYPGWPKKGKFVHPGLGQVMFYGPPALGDIDGDGYAEVVAGSTHSQVEVWNYDGSRVEGFPKDLNSYSITGASVIGDVDGDNKLEIIVGTEGGKVFVIRGDGSDVTGWPKQLPQTVNNHGAVLADVDNDGKPEIFETTLNQKMYLWNGEDGSSLPGWPIYFPDYYTGVGSGTAIGDIDGDGQQEILKAIDYYGNFVMYAWNIDTSIVEGFPYSYSGFWAVMSDGPTIADLNKDGKVDFCQGSADSSSYFDPAYMFCWTVNVDYDSTKMEWPTFHHDFQRTGRYHYPNIPAPFVRSIEPNSGSVEGDEIVKIRGKNFIPGANVFFGGVKAQRVFYLSSNELLVLTPKRKAAVVNIVVVNPDQQDGVRRNAYEYVGNIEDNLLLLVSKQEGEAVLQWQGGAPLYKVLRGKLEEVSTGNTEVKFLSHRTVFHDLDLSNNNNYFYIIQ